MELRPPPPSSQEYTSPESHSKAISDWQRQLASYVEFGQGDARELSAAKFDNEGLLNLQKWTAKVEVPTAYRSRSAPEGIQTEQRGTQLSQLSDLSLLVQKVFIDVEFIERRTSTQISDANMYNVHEIVTCPLTSLFKCSFVDLVASGPQNADVYTSAYWGTPLLQTTDLLKFHAAEVRKFDADTSVYWIDALANNQHDIPELHGGLHNTPSCKVIMSSTCSGTVVIVDEEVVVFKRSWSLYDFWLSTVATQMQKCHFCDMVAWTPKGLTHMNGVPVEAGPTAIIDVGNGVDEELIGATAGPGGMFNPKIAELGFNIDVTAADAAIPQDKLDILNEISGSRADTIESAVAQCSVQLQQLNRLIQAKFARPAARSAVISGQKDRWQFIAMRFPDIMNDVPFPGA